MMRRLVTSIVGLSVLGVSIFFFLAAARCAMQNAVHLTSPGWSHCHSHRPISHLPLWQLVTTSIVPVGLWLARRRLLAPWRVWPMLAASVRWLTLVVWSQRLRSLAMVGPPQSIRQSYADGLSGGHPTFG